MGNWNGYGLNNLIMLNFIHQEMSVKTNLCTVFINFCTVSMDHVLLEVESEIASVWYTTEESALFITLHLSSLLLQPDGQLFISRYRYTKSPSVLDVTTKFASSFRSVLESASVLS